jgi:hypothetical protein
MRPRPRLRRQESLFLVFSIWVLFRGGWVTLTVLALLTGATVWATVHR